MLPVLLGLGGSALAGAGMLGGMSALTAGAIGSGLGSYLETGDLGQGIQTGLLSFLGGKALSGIMGAGAGAGAGAASTAGQSVANTLPGGGTALQSVPVGTVGTAAPGSAQAALDFVNMPASTASVGQSTLAQSLPGDALASETPSMFQNFMQSDAVQKGILNPGAMGAVGTSGLMSMMGGQQGDFQKPESVYRPEAKAQDRKTTAIPASYKPGIDPEFNYFQPYSLSATGLKEGGITDIADNPMDVMSGTEAPEMMPNDKEIINDAVDAIKGEDPQPEMALGRFLSRYGEEALQDLVQRVQSGEFDQNAQVEEGKVNGAGDGMDDLIPAKLEGEDDVVLSDGEFIVPADVVSGLGNGSSDAGSKALYDMMDRVREMRTGKKEQPKQVPQGEMLPA